MICLNRRGLPRAWLALMKKELGKCQGATDNIDEEEDGGDQAAPPPAKRAKGACTHGQGAVDCNKFCYTVVNKGEWELEVWQDSKIIVCLTNFFSTERAGTLARGAHGSSISYSVWAPEGIWYYNVEGRSPTDGNDQERKKLSLAERRILRYGPKSGLFAVDLAFVNGSIMEDWLAPANLSANQRARLTRVSFALAWASEVFDAVKPLRERSPVGMCIMDATATNSAELLSPASAHVMKRAEHELVDGSAVTRALGFRTCATTQGPKKRKAVPYGVCGYGQCPKPGGVATSQLRCGSCRDGKGAYYHLACFHRCHRCYYAG